MLISDEIARIIERMLDDGGGSLELQRNKLADEVGCVPSQINYVITSRFSTDRGYIVESRRGGGGCIKITKITFNKSTYLMHLLGAIGSSIDMQSARALVLGLYERNLIDEREFKIISSMLTDNALTINGRINDNGVIRAQILKNLVLTLNNL